MTLVLNTTYVVFSGAVHSARLLLSFRLFEIYVEFLVCIAIFQFVRKMDLVELNVRIVSPCKAYRCSRCIPHAFKARINHANEPRTNRTSHMYRKSQYLARFRVSGDAIHCESTAKFRR